MKEATTTKPRVIWGQKMGNRYRGTVGGKMFGVTLSRNGAIIQGCLVDTDGIPLDRGTEGLSTEERTAIQDAVDELKKEKPQKVEVRRVSDPALKSILAISAGGIPKIADALGKMQALRSRVKEYTELLEAEMIAYIEQHGEFEIGDIRYYAGDKKKVEQSEPTELLYHLLWEAEDGDENAVFQYLRSKPFKHGAIEKNHPGVFAACFTVSREPEVREGKPRKRLLSASKKFGREREGPMTEEDLAVDDDLVERSE